MLFRSWLERTNIVVGLGLPFTLAVSAAAFLLTMPIGSATWWTPAGFLIGAALVIAAGAIAPSAVRLSRWLRGATGMLLILLPPLRLLTGGPGWGIAITANQPIIVTLDIAFLLAGGWLLWQLRGRASAPSQSVALQPAE